MVPVSILIAFLSYYKIKKNFDFKEMIIVMVKVNVEKLLKQNKRSKYWLCNQMQITMHNLNKVILGETKSISFKYIHDFCKYLNCTPAELFTVEIEKDEDSF